MSEKKFRKKLFFSCRKIILKKVASDFLHVGHPNLRGVSYIAQIAKCPQNYLVDMSFAWLFRVLNCQERFETASKRFSWTRRWTLKKSYRKRLFFSGRKKVSKKSWKFSVFFLYFKNSGKKSNFSKKNKLFRKSLIFPKKLIFSRNFEFREKIRKFSNFFWNFFSTRKK